VNTIFSKRVNRLRCKLATRSTGLSEPGGQSSRSHDAEISHESPFWPGGHCFVYFCTSSPRKKLLYMVRWCVTIVQGHSRLSKFVPIESPRDFLLVFHCNCMPIFCRFRGVTIYWSKHAFAVLPISVSFEALTRGFP